MRKDQYFIGVGHFDILRRDETRHKDLTFPEVHQEQLYTSPTLLR